MSANFIMRITNHMRGRLLRKIPDMPSLKMLFRTEWSDRFESLMRNRLALGSFRYGRINDPMSVEPDRAEYMIKLLEKYRETHNLELLVDIANICLVEFERHPADAKFHASDDDIHCEGRR